MLQIPLQVPHSVSTLYKKPWFEHWFRFPKKLHGFNAFPVKDGMVLSQRKLTACVGSWPDLVTSLSYLMPQLAAWSQRVCRHMVGVECWNPAFDVTPAQLITGGIVTEFGVQQPHELKDALTAALTWCQSPWRHVTMATGTLSSGSIGWLYNFWLSLSLSLSLSHSSV